MRATVRYLRILPVLMLTALLGAACSSTPEAGDSTDTEMNGEQPNVAEDEGEAMPEGYVGEGEGAPSAEAAPEGEAAPMETDQRRNVEYRWLVDRAMIAKQAGDLVEAERYLDRALELQPEGGTDDAVALRDEVRGLLSKGETVVPRSANLPAAAQEEYEIEAERTYREAKAHEEAGNWSEAIDGWDRLLRIVRYAPYGSELSEKYSGAAEVGRSNARAELARQRQLLEQEAMRRELRMSDLRAQAEEERRREEIVELWRQAVYNLELRRFQTAAEIVDRVLYLDPQFRMAENLKRDIADRRLMQMNRDTFEARMAGWQEALRQLREALNPQIETVRYPTGVLAERIKARRDRAAENIRLDPREQEIQNELDSRVMPVLYEEETLANVIADIRRRINIPLHLHADVQDRGEDLVTISLDDIPVGAALRIILGDMSLRTEFFEGVLFVVDGANQDVDPRTVVTRVHDVRDLTFNIQEFAGPKLRLISAPDGSGGPVVIFPPETERTLDIDRIQELIEETVAPDSWMEPNALLFFGGQLVATHTPRVQAELRDFLDELRKIAGLMVNIEVRFISVQDDFLQDFGIDFRGLGGPANVPNQANIIMEDVTTGPEDRAGGQFDNGSGGIAPANPSAGIFFNNQDPNNPPVNFNQDIRGRFEHIYDNSLGNVLTGSGGFAMQFAYFVDLTQINAVINAVQKKRKARILIAPRLTAFNTQRANITIVNQIPYIQDFEVNVATTAAIANPVVDTILDGMVLDVKPTISNDRRFITVEVQPTVAELLLPIPTFTTTLGPTSTVTIQIPEIKLQAVQTTVRVPDGGAVVIAGLKTVRDKWVESGVPILSDIPLLGMLFRRQGRSQEQFNLVIVVHAKVIDLNDEELRRPGWN